MSALFSFNIKQGARGIETERDRQDRGHMHSSTTRQVHGTAAGRSVT